MGSYRAAQRSRELLLIPGPDASSLLLDTEAGSLADARVVARLSAEEPRANALLIVEMYLSDPTRGRCRRLVPEDLAPANPVLPASPPRRHPAVIAIADARYEIRAVAGGSCGPQLRWTRSRPPARISSALTVREVIGTLERYEPARSMTDQALADPVPTDVGVSQLTLELSRLLRSPIVLNRGLREAVARTVLSGTTMSEIAMRCGRFKCDRRGQRSGETSWLARRIGQMPEGGQPRPTPWIHSDTLALIARDGLHISPSEVEL